MMDLWSFIIVEKKKSPTGLEKCFLIAILEAIFNLAAPN